jgi:hypothetical protein
VTHYQYQQEKSNEQDRQQGKDTLVMLLRNSDSFRLQLSGENRLHRLPFRLSIHRGPIITLSGSAVSESPFPGCHFLTPANLLGAADRTVQRHAVHAPTLVGCLPSIGPQYLR